MQKILKIIKKLRKKIYFYLSLIIMSIGLYASGGYDNGTSIGKGNLGVDLTWNPFNYWEKGQSYAVISYGLSQNLNIHGYYSIPVKGLDNYYIGIFYQFFNNKRLDLATAFGIRKYIPKKDQHLFYPQILYTLYLINDIRIGGSFVRISNIDDNYNILGITTDIGLIIPIYKPDNLKSKIKSIDFTIGAFRPILWRPEKGFWHPTYSVDIKFRRIMSH